MVGGINKINYSYIMTNNVIHTLVGSYMVNKWNVYFN